jgi:hypothetical protein
MAILTTIDDWTEGGSRLADFCFLCREALSLPAVYWAGGSPDNPPSYGAEIWLHPKCAKGLAARLARDAKEVENGKVAADEWLRRWKEQHEREQ